MEFKIDPIPTKDGYFLRRFCMAEHNAIRMNAPNCFYTDGIEIDSCQSQDLERPAVVIGLLAL